MNHMITPENASKRLRRPSVENNPMLSLACGEIAGVLALIIRTVGPSYRAVGASMVFSKCGDRFGSLSSGCIEADLAIHADKVRETNVPQRVLYGQGSPFIDIQLPCGGGLEILLLPQPSLSELALISAVEIDRKPTNISIDLASGKITAGSFADTQLNHDQFILRLIPSIKFVVFGKGPEACTFVKLTQSLGYLGTLVSPDSETLTKARLAGWSMKQIFHPHSPEDIDLDDRTAVLCFFHDHEWEAPILKDVVGAETFYIGCQGSMRTRDNRMAELSSMGVSAAQLDKIHGPIGLIPSVRDSNTLAVSVLAEILSLESV